ncbi:hypothetical protein QTN25_008214 [Entamoeba marina]
MGFKDNDVTIQPMDLSVSRYSLLRMINWKVLNVYCFGNTYYSPSINLEDDEDPSSDKSVQATIIQNNAVVSDINTESVLIKQNGEINYNTKETERNT